MQISIAELKQTFSNRGIFLSLKIRFSEHKKGISSVLQKAYVITKIVCIASSLPNVASAQNAASKTNSKSYYESVSTEKSDYRSKVNTIMDSFKKADQKESLSNTNPKFDISEEDINLQLEEFNNNEPSNVQIGGQIK